MWKAFVAILKNWAFKVASVAVAGSTGGVSILANFVMRFLWRYVDMAFVAIWKSTTSAIAYFKIDKIKKENEKKAATYEETLKDGVTEDAQRDASLDLLNGRKP